jgi:cytochrome subunit of sulfide dehydrogenase
MLANPARVSANWNRREKRMIVTKRTRQSKNLQYVMLLALMMSSSAWADVGALLGNCADCHGKDGASVESDVPIIGGYSSKYLADSLTNYRNKARPCPEAKYRAGAQKGQSTDMCSVAARLSDADVAALAGELSKKPFVRAKQAADAAKAERGKRIHDAHCTKCHEDGGSSPDDDAGILAGQWMPYVRHTFEEFGSGQRPIPKKMKPKFDELSADDIDALINYFGSFQ